MRRLSPSDKSRSAPNGTGSSPAAEPRPPSSDDSGTRDRNDPADETPWAVAPVASSVTHGRAGPGTLHQCSVSREDQMQDRRMILDRRQAARRHRTSGSEAAMVSMATFTMASSSPGRKPAP